MNGVNGGISGHLRSNAVGYVALFIALGGAAYAAGLAKDSVKAKQIKQGAVRSAEVKDHSLTGADIQEATLDLPAQGLLDKLKTVDGAGSGLSADSLDDLDSTNLYTKTDSDTRFPLADESVSMITATSTSSYIPFVDFAELDMACDAGGVPSVSLKNISTANLRVYTDTGLPDPLLNAPLNSNASTAATSGAPADNTADHVTYLARGPGGTMTLDVWVENQGAPNATNCLFNIQVVGQGIGLTPAS
ncbi:MAG: hypothetical protein QOI10_2817 [Solirubrobacterales bacterium]|nr:hypothetical protein [Solirubrobacterales bacterium]